MVIRPDGTRRSDPSRDSAAMVLKAAAGKLSIPDLFRVLDEKLEEECSRSHSLTLSAALLVSEVCDLYLAPFTHAAAKSNAGTLDQDTRNSSAR